MPKFVWISKYSPSRLVRIVTPILPVGGLKLVSANNSNEAVPIKLESASTFPSLSEIKIKEVALSSNSPSSKVAVKRW